MAPPRRSTSLYPILAADKIRKHQRVGASRHLRARRFRFAHRRGNRGVSLQFAVDIQLRRARLHDLQRFHHFVHLLVFAAAFGGKAQQRDRRLGADQHARALRRGDGDIGQLAGVGIDHHGAIRERHQAIVPLRPIRQRHDEHARYQAHFRVGTDAVQRRAHGLGGAVHGAAHAAIGIARAHHQGREVQRPPRDLAGFHLGYAFGPSPFVIQGGVFFGRRRAGRVHERDALDRGRWRGAQQYGFDHAFGCQPRGGLEHAWVVALGENDGLFQFAGSRDEPRHEELRGFGNGWYLS
jgi:hypothetical protein